MSTEIKKEIALEIAHVLFIDIVGYSKLLIDEQSSPRSPRKNEVEALATRIYNRSQCRLK